MKRTLAAGRPSKRKKVHHSEENIEIDLEDAIDFFKSGHQKSSHADRCLKVVQEVSRKDGLSSENITILVDVIADLRFKTTIVRKLVYCLIPCDEIESSATLRVLSSLTSPVIPFSLKVDLVKWLCTMYSYLDSELLSCTYALLFVQLQSDILRPYICELLYKVTKAEHVTAYRIKFLTDTQSQMGNQACLLALLQLYTNYRPDLVIVYCKYKKFFLSLGRLSDYVAQVKKTEKVSTKKRDAGLEELIIKKEVTSFSHLSEVINSLKGNVGIVKLLQSPLRRVLFTSGLPEDFMIRLKLFLRIALFTETSWAHSFLSGYPRDSLLPILSTISSEIIEANPEVLAFIASYFKIWDGQKSLNLILEIVEYWEIRPFYDILDCVLNPLYKHFCYSSVAFKCSFISCLTNLYKNWVLYETPRFLSRAENLAMSPTYQKQVTIFERESVLFDPNEQVQALATYITKLCSISLHMHADHPHKLLFEILKFFEMSLIVREYSTSAPLCLPSPIIICAWVFSSNGAILAGVCGLICRFKGEIYKMKQSADGPSVQVAKLNSYISDMCNVLALRAAFKQTKISIFFREKLPSALRKTISRTADSFSIYRHPALFGLALIFLQEFNAEGKEISLEMLLSRTPVREAYFKFLSSQGFDDIVTFLRTFVRTMSLMPHERASNRDVL